MWFSLNEWFWYERFWLFFNYIWVELEDSDGLVYVYFRDMLVVLFVVLVLVVVRFVFER